MIVMTIAFAALVSGGMGMMVFQGLAGVGDILLPLSLLPSASCDRDLHVHPGYRLMPDR